MGCMGRVWHGADSCGPASVHLAALELDEAQLGLAASTTTGSSSTWNLAALELDEAELGLAAPDRWSCRMG